MASLTQEERATLDGLDRVDGKEEMMDGRIVHLMATGFRPSRIAARIDRGLKDYTATVGQGVVLTGNMGSAVPELSSGRESFSPDAAYDVGPLSKHEMDFIPGPPTLAVEVRSKSDYGPVAEAELAPRRADYFEADTRVVWDVDPQTECVLLYRPESPDHSVRFGRCQIADAEPAVPGWRVDVDEIFA